MSDRTLEDLIAEGRTPRDISHFYPDPPTNQDQAREASER